MPPRPAGDARRQVVRGPQRVPGQPVPQRRHVHQPRDGGAVLVPLPERLLGRQLRAHAGGADPAHEHGRARHHTHLPPPHHGYGL